jgi:hypothetical protein
MQQDQATVKPAGSRCPGASLGSVQACQALGIGCVSADVVRARSARPLSVLQLAVRAFYVRMCHDLVPSGGHSAGCFHVQVGCAWGVCYSLALRCLQNWQSKIVSSGSGALRNRRCRHAFVPDVIAMQSLSWPEFDIWKSSKATASSLCSTCSGAPSTRSFSTPVVRILLVLNSVSQ